MTGLSLFSLNLSPFFLADALACLAFASACLAFDSASSLASCALALACSRFSSRSILSACVSVLISCDSKVGGTWATCGVSTSTIDVVAVVSWTSSSGTGLARAYVDVLLAIVPQYLVSSTLS